MSFVPADHSTTIKNVGPVGTLGLMAKAAFGYRRTMGFYLRNGRLRDLSSFLFTKTLVPTGEGSGELAYYAIGPLLQRFPQFAPYPKFIEVEVTSRCNKRCIICEHTWWKEPARDLTLEEFAHLTDQFDLKWANLTGEGDAFLNKDYLDMIRHLRKRHTSVYLVDSFDLIDEDTAHVLVGLGVEGIYISMDGATKETYEGIKVGCDYDRVITNIRNLLHWKGRLHSPLPEICFRFIVNRKNVHEMADFVETIQKLGDRNTWGDGSKIHFAGLLNYPEVHELYLETIPATLVAAAIEASRSDGCLPVVFAHTEERTNPSTNRCLAWMEPYFALVPEHMALPCCAVLMSNSRQRLLEYSFGDYTKEPMRDIWNHPYYQWFRSAVTNRHSSVPMLCYGCRAYDTTERVRKYGIDGRSREYYE